MIQRPAIPDERILACLRHQFGLPARALTFLPLGADQHAAVYSVRTEDGGRYFLKLKQGPFDPISVTLPGFLRQQGIQQILAPLVARTGQPWTDLNGFKVIVYPFVEGQNGYQADLSDRQWAAFGSALKKVHSVNVPAALRSRIRQESYSPKWRDAVRSLLSEAPQAQLADPLSAQLADFLETHRDRIDELIERAGKCAAQLTAQRPQSVLCHSDIHAGNILAEASGAIYLVDWDEPILAPRERDLMSIGGGLMGAWRTPAEEEAAFYPGYGRTEIDRTALAYYRCERIIEDIALFCEQVFSPASPLADREQSLRYLQANFAAHGTIAIALQPDGSAGDRQEFP